MDARASKKDKAAYPEIQKAFYDWGENFFFKSYDVTTEDGYELTMFRILGKRKRKTIKNQWTKGVVLLLHGFTKDSYTWFDRRRGDETKPFLPHALFVRGYDVWLGNIRGTRYSITHEEFDRDASNAQERAFFDYEATDIARNDIPAMVKKIMLEQKKIKDVTGRPCKKVNMIGHSHGAALMLASLSYTVKSDRYVSQVIGVEPCLLP